LKINKIVIVGGGSSGWMTAATLVKSFPKKDIVLVEPEDIPIIGVGESTLQGIKKWSHYIGIQEKDFFPYTDASYKLSIKFTDFYKKDFGSFYYPFGAPLYEGSQNSFWDWHYKKYFYPETPIEDFVRCLFPASALFETNKMSENINGNFDNYNYNIDTAYHFDAIKFGQWLKERYCIPKGVKNIRSSVVDAKINENGIEEIILSNGEKIKSDLFVDCTGFLSLLLEKYLKEPFESYEDILPNNKAWATQVPYKNKEKELEGFTNCTAIENGWCWNIPLWSRIGSGYVYSDRYVSKEKSLDEFKKYLMSEKMTVPRSLEEVNSYSYKEINMKIGIHTRTFVKNVVAIGLSAGFIEPLESNGLFSVHEFLFKLVDILQRDKISQFDRDMYNNSVKDLFDNFAKFVSLHYALSHRDDTKYWQDIQEKNFSDKYGDPYFPYLGRSDSFYHIGWRYMTEWGHPKSQAGITYISTGMNLMMMNDYRIFSLEWENNINIKEGIKEIIDVWERRKNKWNIEAKKSKTLEKFIFEKFYT
jgi:hypothetical protein